MTIQWALIGICREVRPLLCYRQERTSVPLFRLRMLTRQRFIAAVRRALVEAGIDPSRYAGHSFRVGAATTAALRGLLIKTR